MPSPNMSLTLAMQNSSKERFCPGCGKKVAAEKVCVNCGYDLSDNLQEKTPMTNFADQIPFAMAEFALNPERRCPCILILDTSGSMNGQPIAELNLGLSSFKEELLLDSMATKSVELAVVTFGPVHVESDFQSVESFQPKKFQASGDTPMGQAIEQGIKMLQNRKAVYRQNGIDYFRPWVFLFTDGAPTDSWQNAANLIKIGEQAKSFTFFAVGVQQANMDILRQISIREPLKLKGLMFREFFQWLSGSLSAASSSTPGEMVPLQSPSGWGEVG